MATTGDAYETIERFWQVQDGGDYTALISLFSDDAQLVDPIYGTFEGREAIAEFMTKMNQEVSKAGASFVLDELAGDDTTAWAQWIMKTPDGDRTGVGIYRVHNGEITYYRDYLNE